MRAAAAGRRCLGRILKRGRGAAGAPRKRWQCPSGKERGCLFPPPSSLSGREVPDRPARFSAPPGTSSTAYPARLLLPVCHLLVRMNSRRSRTRHPQPPQPNPAACCPHAEQRLAFSSGMPGAQKTSRKRGKELLTGKKDLPVPAQLREGGGETPPQIGPPVSSGSLWAGCSSGAPWTFSAHSAALHRKLPPLCRF